MFQLMVTGTIIALSTRSIREIHKTHVYRPLYYLVTEQRENGHSSCLVLKVTFPTHSEKQLVVFFLIFTVIQFDLNQSPSNCYHGKCFRKSYFYMYLTLTVISHTISKYVGHYDILKNSVMCVNKTICTHLFIIGKGVLSSSLHVYKDIKVKAKNKCKQILPITWGSLTLRRW